MTSKDRWVGPIEASEILGVNRSTIQRWIDDNQIQGTKTVGGHRRILESELRSFAAKRRIPIIEPGPSRTLLIMDDDPEIAEFLTAMVAEARPDLRILVAGTGFEAGRLFNEHHPALLLLDLHMPDLDGIEVCRYVRASSRPDRVHVVGVTAERSGELLDRFLAAGAAEILQKPIDPARLLDIVDLAVPRVSDTKRDMA